jgi:hypothetical protein
MITCDVCGVRLMLPMSCVDLASKHCIAACVPHHFRQVGAKPKEPGSADALLLFQVSFAKESGMQQHLAGPTHRKALERQRKEELRLQQLGNNRWAAENAAVRPPTIGRTIRWRCMCRNLPCMRAAQLQRRDGEIRGKGGHDDGPPTGRRVQRRGRG